LLAPPAGAQAPRPAAAVLSLEQAAARSARVADVRYQLRFRLSAALPEYAGEARIEFELDGAGDDLTLDFAGGTVYALSVNGREVDGRYNDFYLTLPSAALREGNNEVDVSFSRPYSDDGAGLYRFEDPEDGRIYLYSDFEPFNQNRLFPAFDQPDLKGRYTTEVTAPADWEVVTNVRETAVEDLGDERNWIFPQTRPLSTYVYALHAGEYRVWTDSAGDVPLRLFARRSLASYVQPEHWFEPTRQGLAFYADFFDLAYPFGKYDQIIVPHFNAGAMENVGAVTFNEAYLSRGVVTRQNRRSIASVVLHEMAHMWFGDLVTMRWWNGLWLNESFATVMSVISMVEATEFTDEWQESYRDTIRAYRADERETTHPIELPVTDTDGAFANFDRITYEKGSAVLVQLNHLVGPEAFRRGVANYLEMHAYGNTGIEDFLAAVSAAADMDLTDWSREWLLTPGTNTVAAEFACADGRIASLALVQNAPADWPTLRTHRTQLGLYYFDADPVEVATLPATYAGARTDIPAAVGRPCPDMIYPNHGDWDFVRVRLEPAALPQLAANLPRFDDALTRQMLWQSVWDLAQDARIPLGDYLDFALAGLAGESDEAALRQVLSDVDTALALLARMDGAASVLADFGPRVEDFLWNAAASSEPGSDRQLLYFDSLLGSVTTPAGIDRLAGLLDGTTSAAPGLEIDQDRRWTLLARLAAHAHPAFSALFAAERERDRSDQGQLRALGLEAALPDARLKQNKIDALLDPSRVATLAEFRAIAGALFPDNQTALQRASAAAALAGLPRLMRTRDASFFGDYVGGLLGAGCTAAYRDALTAALEADTPLHPLAERGLKDSRFETRRCLAMAALQTRGDGA
jgi:aminopeptidase N